MWDGGDGVQASGVFGREAHDHREVPVAAVLVEIARCLSADRGCDRAVYVAGREAIARRAGTVDVDANGRLSERGEHGNIGNARHCPEDSLDLTRPFPQAAALIPQ